MCYSYETFYLCKLQYIILITSNEFHLLKWYISTCAKYLCTGKLYDCNAFSMVGKHGNYCVYRYERYNLP